MAYVKAADSSEQQPEPSLSNCVQLLLASHYLQVRASTASMRVNTTCCLPPLQELTASRAAAATTPQIPPVLRSCVAFIAASLLALAPTAAAQLCSLESCLLDKVAKVCVPGVLEHPSSWPHSRTSRIHTAVLFSLLNPRPCCCLST